MSQLKSQYTGQHLMILRVLFIGGLVVIISGLIALLFKKQTMVVLVSVIVGLILMVISLLIGLASMVKADRRQAHTAKSDTWISSIVELVSRLLFTLP